MIGVFNKFFIGVFSNLEGDFKKLLRIELVVFLVGVFFEGVVCCFIVGVWLLSFVVVVCLVKIVIGFDILIFICFCDLRVSVLWLNNDLI